MNATLDRKHGRRRLVRGHASLSWRAFRREFRRVYEIREIVRRRCPSNSLREKIIGKSGNAFAREFSIKFCVETLASLVELLERIKLTHVKRHFPEI